LKFIGRKDLLFFTTTRFHLLPTKIGSYDKMALL